jgi:hypothetical protein
MPSRLKVRSAEDTEAPRLSAARVSPEVVDTRTGNGSVQVNVGVTDSGTGVQRVRAVLSVMYEVIEDMEGYGPAPHVIARQWLTRTSGDAHRGTWQARIPIPRCQPTNPVEPQPSYSVDVQLIAEDAARNVREMFPRPLRLYTDDHITPQAHVGSDPSEPVVVLDPSGPVVVRFDELVSGISATSALVARDNGYDRPIAAEPPPPVPGTWSCTGDTGTTTSCVDGPVRTAAFHPQVPLKPSSRYSIWFNPEHVLEVLDLAGNPALGHGGSFMTTG